ncbi:hypothetical protein PENTCL1PPCAC_29706, partial [Pristionchus entomophagus]
VCASRKAKIVLVLCDGMAPFSFSSKTMRIGLVVLLLTSSTLALNKTCDEQLLEEIEKENKEDTNIHACRACKIIALDAPDNCPTMGYECDVNLRITSNVLRVGECDCALLKCQNPTSTLVVGGKVVGKVRCKDLKWITSSKTEANSAVSAKTCKMCKDNVGCGFSAGMCSKAVDMGACGVRAVTLTCSGPPRVELRSLSGYPPFSTLVDIIHGNPDAVLKLTCNPEGTAYLDSMGRVVSSVSCLVDKS